MQLAPAGVHTHIDLCLPRLASQPPPSCTTVPAASFRLERPDSSRGSQCLAAGRGGLRDADLHDGGLCAPDRADQRRAGGCYPRGRRHRRLGPKSVWRERRRAQLLVDLGVVSPPRDSPHTRAAVLGRRLANVRFANRVFDLCRYTFDAAIYPVLAASYLTTALGITRQRPSLSICRRPLPGLIEHNVGGGGGGGRHRLTAWEWFCRHHGGAREL